MAESVLRPEKRRGEAEEDWERVRNYREEREKLDRERERNSPERLRVGVGGVCTYMAFQQKSLHIRLMNWPWLHCRVKAFAWTRLLMAM